MYDRFVPEVIWRRIRPDAIYVWFNDEVRRRLKWYYMVMNDEAPAKFLLARAVDAGENPSKLDDENLWQLKRRLHAELEKLRKEALEGSLTLEVYEREFRDKPEYSLLHLDVEAARRLANPCRLCERRCMIDRSRRIGACRIDNKTYVHSWFHHLGEEPPLVPSGTIFYGGCNFTCVYCQNYDISQVMPRAGEVVDAKRLAQMQRELRIYGARNINHVGGEPTPNIPTIVESLLYLDVNVPHIWNSNMYMTLEAMEILIDFVDLWLPDFKYGDDKCALRLSAVPRYFEIVTRNIRIAVEHGDMIIRHLVLPNHIECCSKPIMQWISENLPVDRILVNIMDQYRPENLVAKYPRRWRDIARRVHLEEVEEVKAYADKLGILYEPVS
nr:radical SAM protein [Hyperthermus butylicus]